MASLRPGLLILMATIPAAGQITPTIYADIELKQQGNPEPLYFTIRLDRPVAHPTVVDKSAIEAEILNFLETGD